MPITRLNHAVLYVRDVEVSVGFYRDALGFRVVNEMPGAAFMQAAGSTNDHDLGLFAVGSQVGNSQAGRATVGLYHLAWEVDTLDELARIAKELSTRGALAGASDHSTTKSLYGHDPDGLEFEIAWVVPAALINEEVLASRSTIKPLDLDKEIARFGGATRGGIGVSFAAVP
jgi:catechol-2,3-dioxygenase